ncbi:hypothetical protein Hesp01_44310 [Herbidospora sp. NBRC 101105]|nr:hypothetical protein Hesp01_44310 [Herbidospora sp. NBRC 101105]
MLRFMRRIVLACVLLLALLVGVPARAATPPDECPPGEIAGITSLDGGYWLAGRDGRVHAYGTAKLFGSPGRPAVAIEATASGEGYWLAAADGTVWAYGDAKVARTTTPALTSPVVGSTRTEGGLWLTTADGTVVAPDGTLTARRHAVVDIVATASGKGYWLVAADGSVWAYGDAAAVPKKPSNLKAPVVSATSAGAGLVLAGADGAVFALAGAAFHGSAASLRLTKPIIGVAAATADGYTLAAGDGAVFTFGTDGFMGNAVTTAADCAPPEPTPGSEIVRIATAIKDGRAMQGWQGGFVPYAWGGGHGSAPGPSFGTCNWYTGPLPCRADVTFGVDCSGFARWVYHLAYGRDVLGGENTNGQLRKLTRSTTGRPGDLVFYGRSPSDTRHVAVFIGDGKVINALRTGTVIRVDPIDVSRDRLPGFYRVAA